MAEFQFAFVGPSEAGKTALLGRLAGKSFNEKYELTHGVDFSSKPYPCWDVSGGQSFASFINNFLRNRSEFVLTLPQQSLNIKEMLGRADFWLESIAQFGQSPHVCICITKTDLKNRSAPKIEEKDIEELISKAKDLGIEIKPEPIYTSAKNGDIKALRTYLDERNDLFQEKQRQKMAQEALNDWAAPQPTDDSSQPDLVFPQTYQQIWDSVGNDLEGDEQQKAKIIALISDYTMGKGILGFLNRLAHCHVKRHHCQAAQEVLNEIKEKPNLSSGEILEKLQEIKPDNPLGSLSMRTNFIAQKLNLAQEAQPNPSTPMPSN